jgi:tetratricopeptide (TPR) repeat protein
MKKKAPKTDEEKEAARARRAEAAAARARAERKQAQETMDRRRRQLTVAKAADDRLRAELREISRREKARENLADHVGGFYEEIDKLAKGKAMLEATNLAVDEANQIIRAAKVLVTGDVYLDHIKEFVPAGENPVYPDVLVTMRNVRQALGRAESQFASLTEAIETAQGDTDTVLAALELFVEENVYATIRDVKKALLPSEVIESWFVTTPAGVHFDYDRLDEVELSSVLSVDATDQ